MTVPTEFQETIDDLVSLHLPVALLARVARGEVDMVATARRVLARRGLSMDGEITNEAPVEKAAVGRRALRGGLSRLLGAD